MSKWLVLSIGGIAGTLARYLVAAWVPGLTGTAFPYGTLAINLSACLMVGIFDSLAGVRAALGPEARLLLMTGFCGAYSTFSTWLLETSNLVNDGQFLRAGLNLLVSVVLGLVMLRLGSLLGSVL